METLKPPLNLSGCAPRHPQHLTISPALTVGEQLRTTLTPLTFSKPLFDGIQWDMQSDKYALTFIASRIDNPAVQRLDSEISEARETVFTNLYGLRGVAQVGDFATLE